MNVHYEPHTPPVCKLEDLNTGNLFILAEGSCDPRCVCVVTAEVHCDDRYRTVRRLNDGGISYLCTTTKVLQVKIDEITVSLSSAGGGGCGCG